MPEPVCWPWIECKAASTWEMTIAVSTYWRDNQHLAIKGQPIGSEYRNGRFRLVTGMETREMPTKSNPSQYVFAREIFRYKVHSALAELEGVHV